MKALYSKDHVWIRREDDSVRIGLSDFAQNELGEIVFVEAPEVGKHLRAGETVCSIDALKSTSDVYAPISGSIVEVNERLSGDKAKLINADPLGDGWICRMTIDDEGELDALLSEEEYQAFVR